jgi:hypothetical protein
VNQPLTTQRRRWASPVIVVALALIIAGFALVPGTARRASADAGCSTDEAVACIPLPPDATPTNPCAAASDPTCGQPGPATAGAPSIAVAVPIAVRPCPLYPDPYGPPIPSGCCTPGPALGSAAVPNTPSVPVPPGGCCLTPVVGAPAPATPAVPVPPPYFCPTFRGIYATINGGNAADVHALRTLTTDGLSQYWSQGALSSIQGQVADLESRGVYATPRLFSIAVQDASFGPGGTAIVHTMEHWLYQERSLYDGSLQLSQDEWVANEYDLNLFGNAWYITYNNATLVPGP